MSPLAFQLQIFQVVCFSTEAGGTPIQEAEVTQLRMAHRRYPHTSEITRLAAAQKALLIRVHI